MHAVIANHGTAAALLCDFGANVRVSEWRNTVHCIFAPRRLFVQTSGVAIILRRAVTFATLALLSGATVGVAAYCFLSSPLT